MLTKSVTHNDICLVALADGYVQLKSSILGRFSSMQKHVTRLEQEVRDLRKAFETRKDDDTESQSRNVWPDMQAEARGQIKADIQEGILQVCNSDIVCNATCAD